ncbi:MAG: polysaccharide biosynthesis C-terminal domain-containing protein [Saprospiraceae bacterium]|nr:polysaccharide biosynthesis C-terminal domain-containing protein [Saprospiraceae bacterium]
MKFNLTNTKALQLFHLLRQGSMILTAILLTKSSLSLSDIGAYEMLMYIGYALSFWWVSGLVQGLLSKYPTLDVLTQEKLIFNAYLLFFTISLVIFLIVFTFQSQVLTLLIRQTEVQYFSVFLIFMLLNFPTYLLENLLLLKEKSREILAFGICSFIGQLAAVILPVYMGWEFYWSFVGLAIFAGCKHFWLFINIWKQGIWQWRPDLIKNWIILSFPLILYALLAGFNVAFDNWLVHYHFGGDEAIFAIFRYGAQELPLTLALTNAFSTAVLPEVAQNLDAALASIRSKSRKLFHLLFPLSIILILTDRWLFPFVFNEAFIASVDIFNIYLLIIISRLVFTRPILVGLQANKEVLIISIIELAVNIIISFILVQYLGLIGIAIGTLIAYTLEKIMLCAYLYMRFGVAVQAYTDLRWFILYTIILIIAFIFSWN